MELFNEKKISKEVESESIHVMKKAVQSALKIKVKGRQREYFALFRIINVAEY